MRKSARNESGPAGMWRQPIDPGRSPSEPIRQTVRVCGPVVKRLRISAFERLKYCVEGPPHRPKALHETRMAPAHSSGLRRQEQFTISDAEKLQRKSIDGESGSRTGRRSNYRTRPRAARACVRLRSSDFWVVRRSPYERVGEGLIKTTAPRIPSPCAYVFRLRTAGPLEVDSARVENP